MKLMQHHMILNWTGRISGLLITAFFAAFFIGEGIPDMLNGNGKELLEFIPFTLLSLAGYFIFRQDMVMALVYALPSGLTGLCFIAAANKELI